MIGSHNKPPPPSKEGSNAFIAAAIGDPEIPLGIPNGTGGVIDAASIRGSNSTGGEGA